MKIRQLALFIAFSAALSSAIADEFSREFVNPPETTKPWCYWYWLNGDITREGITKDLETMARVGIKRAMIGNIEGGGPVRMYSPEWYALTRHAFKEAHRLSVELMSFNAPGWSQSGGPWIKPEQSMRRVAWEEFPARGGPFSKKVRAAGVPAGQDIAVLALPRLGAVSITGSPHAPGAAETDEPLTLARASWIWHPAENGAASAPAATRWFKRVFEADPARLTTARVLLTADNSYVLSVNGKDVLKDETWETMESASIRKHLKKGANTIAIAVTNTEVSPAGVIAAAELKDKAGKVQTIVTDKSWLASTSASEGWLAARAMGPMGMSPWRLKGAGAAGSRGLLRFAHAEAFTARALVVHGKAKARLYALRDGEREFIADIHATGGSAKTDFLPNAIETFSFKEVAARTFELAPAPNCRVVLTSAPIVAQVIEKQMGRVHPTPSPSWESYIFPKTVEPDDPATVIQMKDILDLTGKLGTDGTLNCTLPEGDWTIICFGMVTTGKKNAPAPPEGTGLEVDKMSRAHTEHHFHSAFDKLMGMMTPEERSAFKGITIDSYEVGAQNWTDGFAAEFEKRNGYNPLPLLPVMTGRVVDSAKTSDQFLWDLRRTVADMIAENYVGGLRDIAHKHGLSLWCENYGHWGFPGEFTVYGAYSDEIGGEFWTANRALGTIECRAASSTGHIYGKYRVYAEAFTSGLNLGHHPYVFKARGEELFCEGINHFVLHVSAHQPRDGVPGKNPGFGTAFHRNTPWFNHSRDWVTYLQRCHTMLQHGEPVADVAVYIGDFAPQMTGPANPVPAGYDYDYIGSDAILRKLQVIDGEWVVHDEHDPKRIAARWKLLAMPELKYVRPQVLKRLDELKARGGRAVESVPVPAAALREAGVAPIVSEASCPLRWKARRLDDGMMFFLCNFQQAGTFEATLRVRGKAPELFNPVTGKVKRPARFKSVEGGTRIAIDVRDRSDSFFVVFRDKPAQPSVVAAPAAPDELDLFYDEDGRLTAETAKAGSWTLTLSDGSERTVATEQEPRILAIDGPWKTVETRDGGFTVVQETGFDLPADFGTGRRVYLDLAQVQVMARVTLNGKVFDTLWMPPFALDVTDTVMPGGNTLRVLVTSTSKGKPALGKVQLRTATRIRANES